MILHPICEIHGLSTIEKMYDIIMILSMTPNGTLPRSHLPWSIVMKSVPAVETDGHCGGPGMTPNWSRLENSVILLGATILYAVLAESLINTVEVVLSLLSGSY